MMATAATTAVPTFHRVTEFEVATALRHVRLHLLLPRLQLHTVLLADGRVQDGFTAPLLHSTCVWRMYSEGMAMYCSDVSGASLPPASGAIWLADEEHCHPGGEAIVVALLERAPPVIDMDGSDEARPQWPSRRPRAWTNLHRSPWGGMSLCSPNFHRGRGE